MDVINFSYRNKYSKKNEEHSFGILRDTKINIFLLDDFSRSYFVDNSPNVLIKIIEKFGISKEPHLIKWTYSSGAGHSEIFVEWKNDFPTAITFENGAVLEPYCTAYKISDYAAAFNSHLGLSEALLERYPADLRASFSSKPVKRYLVHTPNHSNRLIHTLKAPYENLDGEDYPVVLADTNRFISYWKRQCSPPRKGILKQLFKDSNNINYDSIDADDFALLASTQDISDKYAFPDEMACGVCLNYLDKIRFTNGRHRTVNFANFGAPYIPIQTSKCELGKIVSSFEWTGK